jgi:hypothetical protein
MSVRWSIIGIVAALIAAAAITAGLNLSPRLTLRPRALRSLAVEGAVILEDSDAKKESPIAGVTISVDLADSAEPAATAVSNFSGYFKLELPSSAVSGESVTLRLRHPDHQPVDLEVPVAGQLHVIRMASARPDAPPRPTRPDIVLSDIVVRYTVESRTAMNIGSGAKTFDVDNSGNIPCDRHPPCSPDGKWKATDGGVSLDAGTDNEFRNARLSCIAGPCAFTRVVSDGFSRGGQVITATVRNWSDATTFALEAEVYRPQNTNTTQRSYPIILGRQLNFTLAASAEGVSIEAEVDGLPIIFPLTPNGVLSWAACDIGADKGQARLYRCELKPGYIFKDHPGD